MAFDVRTIDLAKLNSLTKYPSIPTYHAMGERGMLTPNSVAFPPGPVVGTEKIDGTNARVLVLPDNSYILGSREQLLYAEGDLIGDMALGIVEALRPLAPRMKERSWNEDSVSVFYGELYGGKVTAASKQYTSGQAVGFRLFDIAIIPDYGTQLSRQAADIASWRDGGGQMFLPEAALAGYAKAVDIPLTPRLQTMDASMLPTSIEAMQAFLQQALPISQSMLDANTEGRPEGIVWRTENRSVIAKARFEDYKRTLRISNAR